jgi:amino acid transporter
VIPTLVGLCVVGQWDKWAVSDGISFVQVGKIIGGSVLGVAMLAAAISSNFALYSDFLATGTRIPFIMAEDHLFPKFYSKLHPKYGTPYISIIIMAVINAILCTGSFSNLIVFDVFLIMFYTIMIMIAFVVLRVREPNLERPFRVKGGTFAAGALITPAIIIAIIALCTNDKAHVIGGLLGLASGPIAYIIFKKIYGGIASNPFDPKSIPAEKFAVEEDEE